VLYSLGSQANIVDINHAFHLYYNVVCGLSFSRSQPDFEGFLRALRFPPSSKLTPSLFQFDRMQDLPENHFRVSGASWVNIINYYHSDLYNNNNGIMQWKAVYFIFEADDLVWQILLVQL